MKTKWSESRTDRSELVACTICATVAGPCGENDFVHAGRRWEIGLTWPGGWSEVALVAGSRCAATVEVLLQRGGDEYPVMLYRGACAGCGWACERQYERGENLALEDALDHVFADWRRLPVVVPLRPNRSSRQRECWMHEIAAAYAELGFGEEYTPAAGGVIRTTRSRLGGRSHWNRHGFYDVCAGVLDVAADDGAGSGSFFQLGLF